MPVLAVTRVVLTLTDALAAWEASELWGDRRANDRGAGDVERGAAGARDRRLVRLVFGTSWGLAPEVLDRADVLLEPIQGCGTSLAAGGKANEL